jgi:hypothetical protein
VIGWTIIGLLVAILVALIWIAVELALIRLHVVAQTQIAGTRSRFADEVAEAHIQPITDELRKIRERLQPPL